MAISFGLDLDFLSWVVDPLILLFLGSFKSFERADTDELRGLRISLLADLSELLAAHAMLQERLEVVGRYLVAI